MKHPGSFSMRNGRPIIAIAILFAAAFLALRDQSHRRRYEETRVLYRRLDSDFLSYGIDRCGVFMPPDTWYRRRQNPDLQQTFETDVEFITHHPIPPEGEPNTYWHPLTTPVAYISSMPQDPFNPGQWLDYKLLDVPYFTMSGTGILRSVGPDGDRDLDLDEFYTDFLAWRQTIRKGEYDRVHEVDLLLFAYPRLITHQYDPTNGVLSDGDMIGLHMQPYVTFHRWTEDLTVTQIREMAYRWH